MLQWSFVGGHGQQRELPVLHQIGGGRNESTDPTDVEQVIRRLSTRLISPS